MLRKVSVRTACLLAIHAVAIHLFDHSLMHIQIVLLQMKKILCSFLKRKKHYLQKTLCSITSKFIQYGEKGKRVD